VEAPARPIAAAILPLDAAGRIDTDVTCRKCGYNLRGLLPDGICPECATAVGRSLHGDLLRFCDPDWVQSLASGMNWIVAGIVASVVLKVSGVGIAGAMGALGGRGGNLPILAGKLGGALILLIGYWKLTAPDPGKIGMEQGLTARKLVRAAQAVGLLTYPVESLAFAIPILLHVSLIFIASVVGTVGTVATFIYARRLALRIPDESLARSTRIVMWGIITLGVLVAMTTVGGIVTAASIARSMPGFVTTMPTTGPSGTVIVTNAWGGSNPTLTSPAATRRGRVTTGAPALTSAPLTRAIVTGMPAASPFIFGLFLGGCGMGLCGLIFGIWTLRLIDRYRKALRESAEIARRTWAAHSALNG